jgi:hypothetical protein
MLKQRGPYQGARSSGTLIGTLLLFLIGTVLLEHLDMVRVTYLNRVCVAYLDRVSVAYLDRDCVVGPYQGAQATRSLSRKATWSLSRCSSNAVPIKVLGKHGPYQGAQATRSLSRRSSNMVPIKKSGPCCSSTLIGTALLEHLDRDHVAFLDRDRVT